MASLKELHRLWNEQDTFSKFLLVSVVLLVAFAYLPTLQFDYVTQDQWRAFRYQSDVDSTMARLKECLSMLPLYYARTGRPLVWITECLEHLFVGNISDFKYLRPFALIVVVFTVVYLSLVIKRICNDWVSAAIVAAVFITAPAYSFMYLQGWPALMVLLSIPLAVASYKIFIDKVWGTFSSCKYLVLSSALFLVACLIYPIFAFIVLPLVLMQFVCEDGINFMNSVKKVLVTLLYYALLSAVYYLLVKIFTNMINFYKADLPCLGPYEVSAQLSPTIILNRIIEVATSFYEMSPANFPAFHGVTIVILIVTSIAAGIKFSLIRYKHFHASFVYYSSATFLVCALVLLASISPWVFSRMNGLANRHLLPLYFFMSFAMVWVVKELLTYIRMNTRKIQLALVAFVLLPIAVFQNSYSFLEVVSTRAEIEMLRARFRDWDGEGRLNKRFLLVIRPEIPRPLGVEKLLDDDGHGNDNAVLASSKNPVSLPWMVSAILKERQCGRKYNIVDCGLDTAACVANALANDNNVVVAYARGAGAPASNTIQCIVQPDVINFSELTSRPITPVIKMIELPSVTASSVLDEFGPQGLFLQTPPGWHAEKNPHYPQTLKVDLKEIQSLNSVSFLPQDKTLISRCPKSVRIKVSNDEQSWNEVATDDDVCTPNTSGGWHKLQLPQKVEARYMKIEILANCGDPEFLTLRGLKVE